MKITTALLILTSLFLSCQSHSSTDLSNEEADMTITMKEQWTNLITQFTNDQALITGSWEALQQHYTHKNRAYHNLTHIQNMLQEAAKYEQLIADKEVLQLAIWFHDVIYNPLSKDNEEKSADFAKKILLQTTLSKERIEQCYQQILLTKTHHTSDEHPLDHQLMIDFDLEILSRDWETYQLYSQQVRKEYWMYPAPLFKKGRKKAMEHFLERPTIYQTPYYQKEQEAQARANIRREIEYLGL